MEDIPKQKEKAMEIYLYPVTEDIDKLESLAGVPTGTHEKYLLIEEYCHLADKPFADVMEASHVVKSSGNTKEIAPRVFGALLRSREQIAQYQFFRVTGFGEFIHPDGEDELIGGGKVSGEEAQRILDLNAVPYTAEFTEGVKWL